MAASTNKSHCLGLIAEIEHALEQVAQQIPPAQANTQVKKTIADQLQNVRTLRCKMGEPTTTNSPADTALGYIRDYINELEKKLASAERIRANCVCQGSSIGGYSTPPPAPFSPTGPSSAPPFQATSMSTSTVQAPLPPPPSLPLSLPSGGPLSPSRNTSRTCEICGASFASAFSKNNHMRLHDPEPQFSCSLCSQKFRQRSGLNGHMRRAHDKY